MYTVRDLEKRKKNTFHNRHLSPILPPYFQTAILFLHVYRGNFLAFLVYIFLPFQRRKEEPQHTDDYTLVWYPSIFGRRRNPQASIFLLTFHFRPFISLPCVLVNSLRKKTKNKLAPPHQIKEKVNTKLSNYASST